MRIAVLGASGVAGRAFVAHAASRHELVTHRVDLFDRPALVALLAGCQAAVNLVTSIPKPGGRGDWAMNDRIRREGTANLLAACAQAGVETVLQQSIAMLHSAASDRPQYEEDPIHGEGVLASAAEMEALLRASTLDIRVVRGGLFYGPGTGREEGWIEEARDSRFRMPGNGEGWISPVHVEDYGAALVAVLEQGRRHEAYIACDDRPLRLHELYSLATQRAGVDLPACGGRVGLPSFRVTNARLRGLGWRPRHAALQARPAPGFVPLS